VAEVIHLDARQLTWLLAGLDIKNAHKQLVYSEL